jgi:hypothetical protein
VATSTTRSAPPAADPISQFFAGLAQPGHLATLESERATLRFDVRDGSNTQRWHITIHDGDVAVTRQNVPADAVVAIDRSHLQAIVGGRLNATAALLRGLLTCDGNVAVLMMFQRCVPGPPGSTGRVAPISSKTVTAQHDPSKRRPA